LGLQACIEARDFFDLRFQSVNLAGLGIDRRLNRTIRAAARAEIEPTLRFRVFREAETKHGGQNAACKHPHKTT
jgi:hypothetical protein